MTHLAAILGVVVISFSAIFVRLAGVSPDTSAFFRAVYALPPLTLLWLAFGNRRRPAKLQALALLGGFFLGLDLFVWHRAIQWIGAGLATVLANTQVLFVGLAAWLLFGERPRPAVLFGTPLAFVGMVLVSGLGRPDSFGDNPVLGTIFGLLTGLSYATFLLVFRRTMAPGESPFGSFLVCTLGVAATTGLGGTLTGELDLAWAWPAHGWLIALALGSQVIGWLLIAYALPRLPSVETSILLLLQPMSTVLWAFLLFNERLSQLQWGGVALVLAGVALPAAASARSRREARSSG
jgi:drug/metabolite transporter (DMT)-like permease